MGCYGCDMESGPEGHAYASDNSSELSDSGSAWGANEVSDAGD